MRQWWSNTLVWCKHLKLLAMSLLILTAYAKWRAWHYNEGLIHFLRGDGRFLELLTIDLAICGIAYAVGHEARLEKQLKELRSLEGSLSTRRKGSFPTYLGEIGKLAKTAQHLDILVDCLDYGSFFSPHVHQGVHDEICFAAGKRGVIVRMLVCGEIPEPFTGASGDLFDMYKEPDDLLKIYLAVLVADRGFKSWIERLDSQNGSDFGAFREAWFKDPKPDAAAVKLGIQVCLGKEPVRAADVALRTIVLQIRQLWFAEELQRAGVQIRSLSNSEPMFVWLKRKKEVGRNIAYDGLFTFAKAARGPSQLGYTTHDPDLLETFSAIFTEKWEAGEGEELKWLRFLKKQCLL